MKIKYPTMPKIKMPKIKPLPKPKSLTKLYKGLTKKINIKYPKI